jgi:quercetin dioxygenase-like cupin family protein
MVTVHGFGYASKKNNSFKEYDMAGTRFKIIFPIFILLLFLTPVLFAADLSWFAMTDLPPGAQIAIIHGDPHKKGKFIVQLKFPANYIVPAHHHASVAHATVIAGTYYIGDGTVADGNAGKPIHTGESFVIPANNKHYGWTKEETILQIEAMGPWNMIYSQNG